MVHRRAKWKISGCLKRDDVILVILGKCGSFVVPATFVSSTQGMHKNSLKYKYICIIKIKKYIL